ncbi:hypothetical protein [Roseibium denhamense]|uniref:capsular polysaccharide export protein, LipB/KpsS family n=1 Tax=Roseibium denhamense TaxID=76305 RepID=UPI0018AD2E91|nr:hypothetical protein [Roseibium denhamense]
MTRANRARTRLILVLDGPTPVDARRVPASLVLIELDPEALSALGQGESVSKTVHRQLLKPRTANDLRFLEAYRSLKLSAETAGEPADQSAESSFLETLLTSGTTDRVPRGIWSQVMQDAQAEPSSPDDVLNFLLRDHVVWQSPYTGAILESDEALKIYALIQAHWQSNQLPSHCFGAQHWNHPSIKASFSGVGGHVSFHKSQDETLAEAKESGGRILSWAGRTDEAFETASDKANVPLIRIEDGFLRSVGLGAGLARGAMLAADDLGIYYDPSRPSRLEILLRDYDLDEAELIRAETLVGTIRTARVSKYNFGVARQFSFPKDKRIILVPGQVADDAAIRKSRSATIDCAHTENVNLDLLRLARDRHPDAFLIFKPHPDVETGLRKGKVLESDALEYVDEVARDANIVDLIDAVECVETFSSLSGFEALIRGKTVMVHGAPFYAGWGLTEDLTALSGRGRRRSLNELVYLALVKYAVTIDPVTLLPCSPEFLVWRLSQQRQDRKHVLTTTFKRRLSWLGRRFGI